MKFNITFPSIEFHDSFEPLPMPEPLLAKDLPGLIMVNPQYSKAPTQTEDSITWGNDQDYWKES